MQHIKKYGIVIEMNFSGGNIKRIFAAIVLLCLLPVSSGCKAESKNTFENSADFIGKRIGIESDEYDFVGMTERIKEFGKANELSGGKINSLCLAFEEVGQLDIIPKKSDVHKLHIICSYDGISERLIYSLADEISFIYENGTNRLILSGIRDKINA